MPYGISQYELSIPWKVPTLKPEWLLASYTHFMVQLLAYPAWVTLAKEIRKWPSLSSNSTNDGYRKKTTFGAFFALSSNSNNYLEISSWGSKKILRDETLDMPFPLLCVSNTLVFPGKHLYKLSQGQTTNIGIISLLRLNC